MDRRTFLRSATVAGVTAGFAGCIGGSAGSGDYDVGMTARRFDPEVLTVEPGATVVWRNTSTITHTVSAYDDGLPEAAEYFATGDVASEEEARSDWIGARTGALFQGETYEHTFEIPGVYSYFCVPHEPGGMIGRITVGEETPTG
jgi:plastocyanin